MSRRHVVIAALDLNPGSTAVLERAIELTASRPGAEIHVVTVEEIRTPVAMYGTPLVPEYSPPGPERIVTFCREFLAGLARPKDELPHFHVHSVVGLPADEIVWLAAYLDAEVIVMSTHGRRGIKRMLLGSVAEKVVRLAGCPVFVVRDKAHNAAWRIPEIEPLCPDCATARAASAGKQLSTGT